MYILNENIMYSDLDFSGVSGESSGEADIEFDLLDNYVSYVVIYFLLVFIGLIVIIRICLISIERIDKWRVRSRNNDTDDQSWEDFVEATEGREERRVIAFVQEQSIKVVNETRLEVGNHLDIKETKDKETYFSFNFNNLETECCICHELLIGKDTTIETDNKLYMYECGHTIHNECYEDYKKSNTNNNNVVFKCPICRI